MRVCNLAQVYLDIPFSINIDISYATKFVRSRFKTDYIKNKANDLDEGKVSQLENLVDEMMR